MGMQGWLGSRGGGWVKGWWDPGWVSISSVDQEWWIGGWVWGGGVCGWTSKLILLPTDSIDAGC